MRAYLDAHEVPERRVCVADRFRASDEPASAPTMPGRGVAGFRADLNLVRDGFERFDLLDDRVRFLQGAEGATLGEAAEGPVALLRIGREAGSEAGRVLRSVYDRIATGGFVIVDDRPDSHGWREVEAFRSRAGHHDAARAGRRVRDRVAAGRRRVARAGHRGRIRTTARPTRRSPRPHRREPVDLTVVVVFYNMRREAARTLHSLSRAYQEGIDDLELRGHRRRERLRSRPAPRRGVRPRLRPRVPLPRPRAPMPTPRRSRPSTAASAPGAAAPSR